MLESIIKRFYHKPPFRIKSRHPLSLKQKNMCFKILEERAIVLKEKTIDVENTIYKALINEILDISNITIKRRWHGGYDIFID